MAHGTTEAQGHAHHDHTPGFFVRWFCSTNHKDIGTLYLGIAVLAGIVGGLFSLVSRGHQQRSAVGRPTHAGLPV